MKILIKIAELEPGTHIMRKTIGTVSESVVEIPDDDCKEIRPDWGVYHPVVTFSKIECSLKERGLLPWLSNNNHTYFIGVV